MKGDLICSYYLEVGFWQKYKLLCLLESSWLIFLITLKTPNKLLVIFFVQSFSVPWSSQTLSGFVKKYGSFIFFKAVNVSKCLHILCFSLCILLSSNAIWINFTLDLLMHTVVRLKINCTSASSWYSRVVFFFFNLQVCIFSIFSFAGLGTHFRAPKHVYMKWNKGEEVSAKKFNFLWLYILFGVML